MKFDINKFMFGRIILLLAATLFFNTGCAPLPVPTLTFDFNGSVDDGDDTNGPAKTYRKPVSRANDNNTFALSRVINSEELNGHAISKTANNSVRTAIASSFTLISRSLRTEFSQVFQKKLYPISQR